MQPRMVPLSTGFKFKRPETEGYVVALHCKYLFQKNAAAMAPDRAGWSFFRIIGKENWRRQAHCRFNAAGPARPREEMCQLPGELVKDIDPALYRLDVMAALAPDCQFPLQYQAQQRLGEVQGIGK